MPGLTRLFIKAAFAYLAAGLVAGVLLAVARVWDVAVWAPALGPAFVHLLTVGWLTQLIFGVAYWLFPRYSRERPYGWTAPAWAAFWFLNAGLLARLIAEVAMALGATLWPGLIVVSAIAQAAGALAFAAYIWPRVRVK